MSCALSYIYHFLQAMHAHSSVAVGMKGASKAMAAMNKVSCSVGLKIIAFLYYIGPNFSYTGQILQDFVWFYPHKKKKAFIIFK